MIAPPFMLHMKEDEEMNTEVIPYRNGKTIGELLKFSNNNRVSVSMKETEKRIWTEGWEEMITKTTKIWDFFQQARLEQVPTILNTADRLVDGLQRVSMPEDILEYCHEFTKAHKVAKATLLSLVKIPYVGIEQAKEKELKEKFAVIPSELSSTQKRKMMDDIKSVISQKYNLAYDGLRSMARMVTAKWSGTPWDRVTVLMSLCYSDSNGNPLATAECKIRSNIIEKLLPEEFSLWVIEMGRRFGHWSYCDKIAIYPRDVLQHIEDGAAYEICKGVVIKDGYICAYCGDLSASGQWIAEKDESGHYYFWQSVTDYVKNIIPKAQYITVPLAGVDVELKDELEKEFQEGTPVMFDRKRHVTNGNVSLDTYRRDDDWESVQVKGNKFFAKKEFYAKNNIGIVAQLVLSDYTDRAGKKCVGGFMVVNNPMHTDTDIGGFPLVLGSREWEQATGWGKKKTEPTKKLGGLRSHIVKKEVV